MVDKLSPRPLGQRKLNVFLIGGGNMGKKHGRTLYQMANVELIGIFDPAPTSALVPLAGFRKRKN